MSSNPQLEVADHWLHDNLRLDQYPSVTTDMVIDLALLESYGYVDSFSHFINHIVYRDARVSPGSSVAECSPYCPTGKALLPAACLNVYPQLSPAVKMPGITRTLRTKVYRNEPDGYNATRLWEFSVREIIFIGSNDYVKNALARFQALISNKMRGTRLVNASDHFFPSRENRIKGIAQIQRQTKQEVVVPVCDSMAIGSLNYHGTNIWNAVRNLAHPSIQCEHVVSGCVGFGLERCAIWLRALNDFEVLDHCSSGRG
jgi:hypothetical protein